MTFDRTRFVLVTGGAGYIGSHAAWMLRDEGYRVLVIDDLSTGCRALLPDAPFVKANVGDERALENVFATYDVGAIMHFAGSIVVPDSISDPLGYYGNNTAASRTLFAAAVAAGVPHIILSSTASVYGIPRGPLLAEDDPLQPINPYGRSKLMTEWMLADICDAHPVNAGVLRYFNVAGADPACRTGQVAVKATHLIKVALQAALGERAEVAVFGDDYDTADGTGIRDYIHVADLVRAHILLLERLAAAPTQSLTLNCGYGYGYSVLEVLDMVDRLTNRPLTRLIAPRRHGDPPTLVADNRRIIETLDWKPQRQDLRTIIADALAFERSTCRREGSGARTALKLRGQEPPSRRAP